MIKVVNKRVGGSLFHFAHFMFDCLFPEIINDIYKYKEVVREKSIPQTIGNFDKIYTEVMLVKHTELPKKEFIELDVETIIYKNKEDYIDKIYFDKFRNFIFSRYNINNLVYDNAYPEVILIKRYDRIDLIDDESLKKININITTGKERREINKVDEVEDYLKNKYNDKFKSIFLEFVSFEQQVKYFNNAKFIICAHGAALSNLFFCKEKTTVIEVTCNANCWVFNSIAQILNLNHIRCFKNEFDEIISCIEKNLKN
jgi:hypothetical protein